MTRGEGGATWIGRNPTVQEHREAAHDVIRLQENRTLLVHRLERVVVALALTLDAEAAAEERLARIQELAGVHRIGNRTPVEWVLLAERYRHILHAIDAINDELDPGQREDPSVTRGPLTT
jgi:hypothetical protein